MIMQMFPYFQMDRGYERSVCPSNLSFVSMLGIYLKAGTVAPIYCATVPTCHGVINLKKNR